MADKYYELFPDLEEKFRAAIAKADLERVLNITIRGLKNQKDVTKVSKATPILTHLTQADKYYELFPDLEEKFRAAIAKADLERVLNITIRGLKNQKDVTKVSKATPILTHLTQADVIITVNEVVLEMLSELHQSIVIDETIARIGFDYENDKLVMNTPDFETFSLILQKYTCDEMLNERSVVKAAYAQGVEDTGA
jgi:hypothetical protein